MNKRFSPAWISSKRPGKQRKFAANAPLHIKRKMMGTHLSKELRKTHGRRAIPVRKGDTVKVMRGKFEGKTGKVTDVNLKMQRIQIEGIQVKKQDGSKSNVPLKPSNVMITGLNMEDKRRITKQKQETKKNAP